MSNKSNSEKAFFVVVGFPGSGKTRMMFDISNHLDIDICQKDCPCITDSIRQVYVFGRFHEFHGKSEKIKGD